MTGAGMEDEVTKALGNRTDLTQARYLRWLNWAMFDICGFFRKRNFPAKRIHELEGQTLVIVDYDGATRTATVASAWTTTPVITDAYTLHRKKVPLTDATGLAATDIWTVMRLETVVEGSPLTQVGWRKVVGGQATTLEEPRVFARYGDSLIFRSAPEEQVSFRCYYYRQPTKITVSNIDNQADLSQEWHETVVLGAIWRGHERLMEPERAMEAKQQYIDEAGNRFDDYMIEELFIDRGMKVRK